MEKLKDILFTNTLQALNECRHCVSEYGDIDDSTIFASVCFCSLMSVINSSGLYDDFYLWVKSHE